MFKPLLLKVMRPVIQRVLEKQIKDSVNQLDGMLYDIKVEADRAEAEAKRNPDPQNLQNMYQRYASALQNRVMQGKQKRDQLKEKTKDTQVNMAVTQQDSIFKNIALPGGISTKATEYKELAAKGDKWESPIFSIGSAKETSSLPKLANITRKPHGRAGGYGPRPGQGFESHGRDQYDGVGQGFGSSHAGGLTGAGQGLGGVGGGAGQGYADQGQGLLSSGGPVLAGTQHPGGHGLAGQGLAGQGLAEQGLAGQSHIGHGHAGQGLAGQMDNAFNSNTSGTTGLSGTAPTQGSSGHFNTAFGDQNPVFQGRV